MTTLRQAVEIHRGAGRLPTGVTISARDLAARYPPDPAGSVRGVLRSMDLSEYKPWAIILCRFSGAAAAPTREDPVEKFYRDLFAGGLGGVADYWRDASLGYVDVRASQVFGWLEIALTRAQAGGVPAMTPPGPGRLGLCNAGITALNSSGVNTDRFAGFIAVYIENWSKDGVDSTTPNAGAFWIDGSAAGNRVTLTPPHAADIITHEMGHGFGLQHDRTPGLTVDYADPCCIMSQRPLWFDSNYGTNYGPRVCATHLLLSNWMYPHRILRADGSWTSTGTTVPLAAADDAGAAANLMAILPNTRAQPSWDYHLEYARPTGWDRALENDSVFVRRVDVDESKNPTAIILGTIVVPDDPAQSGSLVETLGNVRFEAHRSDASGRIVFVTATAL